MKTQKEATIYDLSVPIDPLAWEPEKIRRKVIDHRKGADLLGLSLINIKGNSALSRLKERVKHTIGLGMDHRDFPDQKGLSLISYTLTTHTGTHLDAPYHYGNLDIKGKPAKTISDIPLEWCYGNGVLLDLSRDSIKECITKEEIQQVLSFMNYQIEPFDIVLLKTGGDKHVGNPKYFTNFRGMSRKATEYLLDQGVKIIGIDSFGFDAPFKNMVTEYLKSKNKSCLWPAHMLGREREYCHIERLANLGSLPQTLGFKVACFPIHLKEADASWCRVVAIFEK